MPQVPIWGCVLIVLAVAALCGALAFFAGVNHRKREAEAAIGSAEDEAKRIISKEKGSRARGQGRNSSSAQRVRTRDE